MFVTRSHSHCLFNRTKPLIINEFNTITTTITIPSFKANATFCFSSNVFVPRRSYSIGTKQTKKGAPIEVRYPPETHILLPIERVLSFINISQDRYGWVPPFHVLREVHVSETPVWAIKDKAELKKVRVVGFSKLTKEEQRMEIFQNNVIKQLVDNEPKQPPLDLKIRMREMKYKCNRSTQAIALTTIIHQILSEIQDDEKKLTQKTVVLTAMGEEVLSFDIVAGTMNCQFTNPLLSDFKSESLLKGKNGLVDIRGVLLIPDEFVRTHRWLKVKTTNKTINYDICCSVYDIFSFSSLADRGPMHIFQRDERYEETQTLPTGAVYATKASLSMIDSNTNTKYVQLFERVITASKALLTKFLKSKDEVKAADPKENKEESELETENQNEEESEGKQSNTKNSTQ
eukprot:TRINITY_DN2048_c1_g1_i1.p1 TRINITY_DN2048_c1_g1~~TRINITY_DN2048_c1_g1_i1.p1  ORF type:complete len:442 (-),score=91.15 TRINITY_DN2048_c1_g1_i1:140-1345(-)